MTVSAAADTINYKVMRGGRSSALISVHFSTLLLRKVFYRCNFQEMAGIWYSEITLPRYSEITALEHCLGKASHFIGESNFSKITLCTQALNIPAKMLRAKLCPELQRVQPRSALRRTCNTFAKWAYFSNSAKHLGTYSV